MLYELIINTERLSHDAVVEMISGACAGPR